MTRHNTTVQDTTVHDTTNHNHDSTHHDTTPHYTTHHDMTQQDTVDDSACRSGGVHVCEENCPLTMKAELDFWGVEEDAMQVMSPFYTVSHARLTADPKLLYSC